VEHHRGAAADRAARLGTSNDLLEVPMSAQLQAESSLQATDPEVAGLIEAEVARQSETICLIPSENYVSRAVLEAMASVFTNKYSEGYAGRRYYEGQQVVDQLEPVAVDRAKNLFGVAHANVQPYSGSPANLAVYLALCDPGDTVMGMALPMGGHLTHGWNVSVTGRWFRSVSTACAAIPARSTSTRSASSPCASAPS
jgi:glycine hydroxymethyltransferase